MKVVGGVNWYECPQCSKKDERRFVRVAFDIRDLGFIRVWGLKKRLSCPNGHTHMVDITG